MANGTIAFDTLQTSGQITGTAKSVDTDYVVNGSAKTWCQAPADNASITSSFNVASLTDVGTGNNQVNLTNNMSTATSYPSGCTNNNNGVDNGDSAPANSSGANSASQYENNMGYVNSSGNMVVSDYANFSFSIGDLA